MRKNTLASIIAGILFTLFSVTKLDNPIISKKYALLVDGDFYNPHTAGLSLKNIAEATLLLYKNNYNIFTLYPSKSSKKTLDSLINHIANITKKNDLVFFYAVGHGDTTNNGKSILHFKDSDIKAGSLYKSLKKIPAQNFILIYDFCHSGDFSLLAYNLKRNVVAMSNTSRDKPGYVRFFSRPLFEALNKENTIRKAFEFAEKEQDKKLKEKTYKEFKPIYFETGNSPKTL